LLWADSEKTISASTEEREDASEHKSNWAKIRVIGKGFHQRKGLLQEGRGQKGGKDRRRFTGEGGLQ